MKINGKVWTLEILTKVCNMLIEGFIKSKHNKI